MTTDNQQIALIQKWMFHPEIWAADVVPAFQPTSQQRRALLEYGLLIRAKVKSARGMTLADEEKPYLSKLGLSIMSGQHCGKDALASILSTHFITNFAKSKVRVTAPAGPQIDSVLWPELHKWIHASELLKQTLQHQATKIFMKEFGSAEWFIEKRTIQKNSNPAEQAEVLGGFHERYTLIVADEASGVPDATLAASEGAQGGHCNLIVMIFNPTQRSGYAYDSQHKDRKHWVCLHWDAEECAAERPPFAPDLALQHARTAEKYGKDSNYYRVRVKGLPPIEAGDCLLSWELVNAAVEREIEPTNDDPLCLGIDVARGGDDKTVIVPLLGHIIDVYPERHIRDVIPQCTDADGPAVAQWAVREVQRRLAEWDRRCSIAVDIIGVGSSVYDHLKRFSGYGNQVLGVNFAELPAYEPTKFHRMRDEVLWGLKEEFESRINRIPKDDELIGELTTIKWDEPSGKIKIEGKKELRKRGLDSPNKLDGYALALYARKVLGTPGPAGQFRFRSRSQQMAGWKVG